MQTLRQLLETLGYTINVQKDDWIRCAVIGHGEQWLGKGLDEATALQDACNTMFPSKAARDLLGIRLDSDVIPERQEVAISPPVKVTVETPPSKIPPKAIPIRRVVELVREVSPPVSKPPVTITKEEPKVEPEEKITHGEALELLREITEEMEDNADDLARMTSHFQRVHIASWLFRSRAIQEKFPNDRELENEVHRIARHLTDRCKTYWPGSIRALQVFTQPVQALEGLIRFSTPPRKWSQVSELLEAYLEEETAKNWYDEYGWRDRALLFPAAPNPDSILNEAVKKIEAVIGTLGGPLEDKRQVSESQLIDEVEDFVMAAHLLRWTRRNANPQQWGIAMGALRWVSRQARSGMDLLQEILADDYKPPQTWASILGRDPEINRKNRLRKKVMYQLPTKDWLEEDLMEWLKNAFQVFTNPQIAKLGIAVREEILGFSNADFADADRSARSRLRKLQVILQTQTDLSEVKLPSEDDLKDDSESLTEPSTVSEDPVGLLLTQVQEITMGKNILFVTNRPEERLHRDLERDLKATVIYKVGDTPRTMAPILKSVDKSRYDMVLMATGFNNHGADTALCRATKAEGIPYIRVQKGRLATTIRAIGRAFNLTGQRNGADEANVPHTP